jgi:hypothetical protein
VVARELLETVARDLNDFEPEHRHVRWPMEELSGYLTEAMRTVVLLRPDANAVTLPVLLEPGSTRQSIPKDGARFLNIVRNMGADGQTPGLPVTSVAMDDLNATSLSWHAAEVSSVVDHFVFDEAVPTLFYVTPPPTGSVYVDLAYARIPGRVEDLEQVLELNPVWAEPLREYVMFRAYGRNDASVEDMSKAERHLSRFFLILGEEAKAKLAFSPNMNREALLP